MNRFARFAASALALSLVPAMLMGCGKKETAASSDLDYIKQKGTLVVGITDFAQGQLGDIVFVDVPTVGESLGQNEVFGSIEAVKTVSDAFLPVSGEILEFNDAVDADPAIVNKDPYGEGWIIKVNMANPAEVDTLLSADDYAKLVG